MRLATIDDKARKGTYFEVKIFCWGEMLTNWGWMVIFWGKVNTFRGLLSLQVSPCTLWQIHQKIFGRGQLPPLFGNARIFTGFSTATPPLALAALLLKDVAFFWQECKLKNQWWTTRTCVNNNSRVYIFCNQKNGGAGGAQQSLSTPQK